VASKNKNKSDSKNFAAKNTMNPPADQGGPKPGPQQPETVDRQVGQYTGRGVPSVEKK
jgi:hypothetical protein